MTAKSLRRIVAEMPDWLSPEEVNTTLANIFEAGAGDTPQAFADALMELMLRAAENDQWLSDDDQHRILAWIREHWATEPPSFFNRLCALTANLKLEEAQALLEEKCETETDPDRLQTLKSTLEDMASTHSNNGEDETSAD